ncbi:hypothetical protein QCA50_009713 [Cerrena zonata]|uniref:Uncharacterized protein n=1 Tax=Cerrena zonata TaxID=2478898 RepID=A0AAW0G1K9_9APHY
MYTWYRSRPCPLLFTLKEHTMVSHFESGRSSAHRQAHQVIVFGHLVDGWYKDRGCGCCRVESDMHGCLVIDSATLNPLWLLLSLAWAAHQ